MSNSLDVQDAHTKALLGKIAYYHFVKKKKTFRKSHFESQREIPLIELVPSPYFFIKSICLVDKNIFARFDEIPSMPHNNTKYSKK